MKRLLAPTVVVWASAMIAAVALHGVHGRPRADALAIVTRPATEGAVAATLVIPDIVITVPRPQGPLHVMRHPLQTPRTARDIYEMRCSEWIDFSEGLEGRHMQRCD